MKEINAYTLTLNLIGITSIVYLLVALIGGAISWSVFFVTLAVSSIGFFYIRLPDESYFNFGSSASFYLLLHYGFDLLILSQLIIIIGLGIRLHLKGRPIYWHRYIISFGMIMIAFLLVLPIFNKLEGNVPIFLNILIIVSLFNLFNDLLRRGIEISILGLSVLSPPTRKEIWAILPLTGASVIVVYRLHLTETYLELAKELVLLVILIQLYTSLSNKVHLHKQLLDEARSGIFDLLHVAGYGVCQVDREGLVQSASSEAELLLSGANGGLNGTPFSSYLGVGEPELQSLFHQTFQKTLTGEQVTLEAPIRTADGAQVSVLLHLTPFIENRNIAGVHILIRKPEKTIV